MTTEPSENLDDALEKVRYTVESVHHIHGHECLCGFKSAVSRERTRHIVTATIAELQRWGYGHVPTALNESADALEGEANAHSYRNAAYDGWMEAVESLRARAAETGGTE